MWAAARLHRRVGEEEEEEWEGRAGRQEGERRRGAVGGVERERE